MRTAAMDDYFFNELKSHPPQGTRSVNTARAVLTDLGI